MHIGCQKKRWTLLREVCGGMGRKPRFTGSFEASTVIRATVRSDWGLQCVKPRTREFPRRTGLFTHYECLFGLTILYTWLTEPLRQYRVKGGNIGLAKGGRYERQIDDGVHRMLAGSYAARHGCVQRLSLVDRLANLHSSAVYNRIYTLPQGARID